MRGSPKKGWQNKWQRKRMAKEMVSKERVAKRKGGNRKGGKGRVAKERGWCLWLEGPKFKNSVLGRWSELCQASFEK